MKIEIQITIHEYYFLAGAALHLSAAGATFSLEPDVLVVDADVVDNIRDYIMESLPLFGLNDEYEVTSLGATMESLIDKLFQH